MSSFESHCVFQLGIVLANDNPFADNSFLLDLNLAVAASRPDLLENGFAANFHDVYTRDLQTRYDPGTSISDIVPTLIRDIEHWYSLRPSDAKARPFLFATGQLLVSPTTFKPFLCFRTHYELVRTA